MKLAGRIFEFYLDSSIHVAIAVFSLLQITTFFIKLREFDHLSYFIFFATISSYNFIKYGVEAEKYLLVTNSYHRGIQLFSFATLAMALYHGYFLSIHTWLGIAMLMVLTGGYALPIFPRGKQLRSLGLLKITLVSIIWAGTTVLLPVISVSAPFTWDVTIETLQRIILVVVLLIPFEIRDLPYDDVQLRTLPQRFGLVKTKKIGHLASLLFFSLTFLKTDATRLEIFGKGILMVFLLLIVSFTKKEQSRYYASFWVESIPIFWWFVLWVLSSIAF